MEDYTVKRRRDGGSLDWEHIEEMMAKTGITEVNCDTASE